MVLHLEVQNGPKVVPNDALNGSEMRIMFSLILGTLSRAFLTRKWTEMAPEMGSLFRPIWPYYGTSWTLTWVLLGTIYSTNNML